MASHGNGIYKARGNPRPIKLLHQVNDISGVKEIAYQLGVMYEMKPNGSDETKLFCFQT